MKRLTLWSVSTLLMMLLLGPGLQAHAGATLLSAAELAGTTYHCARSLTVSFVVSPGTRVKLYKGDMRYFKTYVVREVQAWSDGSTTRTDVAVGLRWRRQATQPYSALTHKVTSNSGDIR